MKILENRITKGTFEGKPAYIQLVEYWDEEPIFREMLNAGPIKHIEDLKFRSEEPIQKT